MLFPVTKFISIDASEQIHKLHKALPWNILGFSITRWAGGLLNPSLVAIAHNEFCKLVVFGWKQWYCYFYKITLMWQTGTCWRQYVVWTSKTWVVKRLLVGRHVIVSYDLCFSYRL